MRIEHIVDEYGDMLFRISLLTLCNKQDAQDAVQETLLRYMERRQEFSDEEHVKAWLIRVIINVCKDMKRFHMRHPQVSFDDLQELYITEDEFTIIEEVIKLPTKLKDVIYLYYIEGYKTMEIAHILHISESVVRKRMQRGREQLKLQCLEGK